VIAGLAAALDGAVPEILRITATPGLSLAVADDAGDTLARAYGLHDAATARPMTTGSVFPAGSMTKLYTAVAVMQLVERGIVGLHDPVERHLGGMRCMNPLGARAITVHDLLTFRSGLAVDTTACSLGAPPPLDEHAAAGLEAAYGREYAGTVPRWASPAGRGYHYANLGISLLGLLVERANPDGLDLPAYLARHVLEPLGMRRTWLSRWQEPPPPERATGYACFRGFAVPSPDIRSADFPANGLQTVPAEHLRLLLALWRGGALDGARILEPATVRLMLTPQVRMGEADGMWPDEGGWWTGLVAILGNLGRDDVHFGHPGSHMWGWWSISRVHPRLGCALAVSVNGWDMMRWHNPANPDATALVADLVAAWFAAPGESARTSWAARRSYLAGALLAERTTGSLGIAEPLTDELVSSLLDGATGEELDRRAFAAGVAAARTDRADADWAARLLREPGGGIAPGEVPALLQDLGAAYGVPAPLWFWPSASMSAAASIA
jgi:CubicO group peptidase (beta-lactamase class C family)